MSYIKNKKVVKLLFYINIKPATKVNNIADASIKATIFLAFLLNFNTSINIIN